MDSSNRVANPVGIQTFFVDWIQSDPNIFWEPDPDFFVDRIQLDPDFFVNRIHWDRTFFADRILPDPDIFGDRIQSVDRSGSTRYFGPDPVGIKTFLWTGSSRIKTLFVDRNQFWIQPRSAELKIVKKFQRNVHTQKHKHKTQTPLTYDVVTQFVLLYLEK